MADLTVRSADLSVDGVYQYELRRRWSTAPADVWIMLNPSTADADIDDPTVRRCVSFSRRWRAGAIAVVNLFALRATDPTQLLSHPDPVGPGNDAAITKVVTVARSHGARVIAAWGGHQMATPRGQHVRDLIGGPLHCLGTTVRGGPRHPLYVRGDTRLAPWPTPR